MICFLYESSNEVSSNIFNLIDLSFLTVIAVEASALRPDPKEERLSEEKTTKPETSVSITPTRTKATSLFGDDLSDDDPFLNGIVKSSNLPKVDQSKSNQPIDGASVSSAAVDTKKALSLFGDDSEDEDPFATSIAKPASISVSDQLKAKKETNSPSRESAKMPSVLPDTKKKVSLFGDDSSDEDPFAKPIAKASPLPISHRPKTKSPSTEYKDPPKSNSSSSSKSDIKSKTKTLFDTESSDDDFFEKRIGKSSIAKKPLGSLKTLSTSNEVTKSPVETTKKELAIKRNLIEKKSSKLFSSSEDDDDLFATKGKNMMFFKVGILN